MKKSETVVTTRSEFANSIKNAVKQGDAVEQRHSETDEHETMFRISSDDKPAKTDARNPVPGGEAGQGDERCQPQPAPGEIERAELTGQPEPRASEISAPPSVPEPDKLDEPASSNVREFSTEPNPVSAPEPVFRAEPAHVINPLADETPEDQPKAGEAPEPLPQPESEPDNHNMPLDGVAQSDKKLRKKIDFNTGTAYYVRIAGILLAICSGIAALLAVVNGFTSVKIAENSLRVTGEAISALFSGYDEAQPLDVAVEAPVTGVTAVKSGGALTGYCVFVEQKGFGGTISLIVGTDPSGVAIGVKILNMSETPGLGSKTNDADYLSQYIGKTSDITLGDNIDAIAGATISSKAVYNAVKAALTAVENLPEGIAGAAAAGTSAETVADTSPETLPETSSETVVETAAETAGDASEVTSPETTSETVSETTAQTAAETTAEATEGGAV